LGRLWLCEPRERLSRLLRVVSRSRDRRRRPRRPASTAPAPFSPSPFPPFPGRAFRHRRDRFCHGRRALHLCRTTGQGAARGGGGSRKSTRDRGASGFERQRPSRHSEARFERSEKACRRQPAGQRRRALATACDLCLSSVAPLEIGCGFKANRRLRPPLRKRQRTGALQERKRRANPHRNPKQFRKMENGKGRWRPPIDFQVFSSFEFVSDFEFRISNFPLPIGASTARCRQSG